MNVYIILGCRKRKLLAKRVRIKNNGKSKKVKFKVEFAFYVLKMLLRDFKKNNHQTAPVASGIGCGTAPASPLLTSFSVIFLCFDLLATPDWPKIDSSGSQHLNSQLNWESNQNKVTRVKLDLSRVPVEYWLTTVDCWEWKLKEVRFEINFSKKYFLSNWKKRLNNKCCRSKIIALTWR